MEKLTIKNNLNIIIENLELSQEMDYSPERALSLSFLYDVKDNKRCKSIAKSTKTIKGWKK